MTALSPLDEDIEMSKKTLLAEELKEEPSAPKEHMKPLKGLRSKLVDGACILLNIASTVTLVFLNKW